MLTIDLRLVFGTLVQFFPVSSENRIRVRPVEFPVRTPLWASRENIPPLPLPVLPIYLSSPFALPTLLPRDPLVLHGVRLPPFVWLDGQHIRGASST